ncbi:hypothetical protein BH24ACT5_BH24ACT5_00010 [soil metagenome]
MRVAVCVCTYQRNDQLRTLIERLVAIQAGSADHYKVGLVIVDDNKNGEAWKVVQDFEGVFPLGVHYRTAGFNNISICRNLALEAGIAVGDVIAMTDDDCLPELDWIDELLVMKRSTGADVVSGALVHIVPDAAPAWMKQQSIFDFAASPAEHGSPMTTAQTNNCLMDGDWLKQHPSHRFDETYGRIGGEDMMFFRGAVRLGMRSFHSSTARVTQLEPIDALTLRSLTVRSHWLGNSEAVTNLGLGLASRRRLVARSGRRLGRAVARPFQRVAMGRPPHLRFCLVQCAGALGILSGAVGFRARHH